MKTRKVIFARICRNNIVQALSNTTSLCYLIQTLTYDCPNINMIIRSGSFNACTHNHSVYIQWDNKGKTPCMIIFYV